MYHRLNWIRPLFPLLLAGILAACSPGAATAPPETTPASQPAEPSPTARPTDTPVEPTQTPTEAPAPGAMRMLDGLGREITLAGPAQAIVSLAPSNTEILYAVGAGDQVVARDSFSDFPAEALALPDIGGGFSPLDLETILSLEPDLVLAADITPPEQVQELEDLGLVVFLLANPLDYEGLFFNLELVGQLTGHFQEGQALSDALRARVEAVQEKVTGIDDRLLVFYQIDSTDPNAPWTAGPGNFIDTLIGMAGGRNLGASLGEPWAQISVEALITQDPDVIFVGDFIFGGVTAQDVSSRAGWQSIAAVENARVYEFDDNLVSRPGPRLVLGLETMAALLYPELFP